MLLSVTNSFQKFWAWLSVFITSIYPEYLGNNMLAVGPSTCLNTRGLLSLSINEDTKSLSSKPLPRINPLVKTEQ